MQVNVDMGRVYEETFWLPRVKEKKFNRVEKNCLETVDRPLLTKCCCKKALLDVFTCNERAILHTRATHWHPVQWLICLFVSSQKTWGRRFVEVVPYGGEKRYYSYNSCLPCFDIQSNTTIQNILNTLIRTAYNTNNPN